METTAYFTQMRPLSTLIYIVNKLATSLIHLGEKGKAAGK